MLNGGVRVKKEEVERTRRDTFKDATAAQAQSGAAFFLNTLCALLIAAIAVFCALSCSRRCAWIAKQRCCLHSLVFCYHLDGGGSGARAAANLHLNGADGNGGKPFSLPISLSAGRAFHFERKLQGKSGVSPNLSLFLIRVRNKKQWCLANCFLLTLHGILLIVGKKGGVSEV
jgi:hypothetical protein